MIFPIPEHDCLIPGLGLYVDHLPQNPLQGNDGAGLFIDEYIRFHLKSESGHEALNLEEGEHFPVLFGQMRKRQAMRLRKPKDTKEMFIPIQHGCELLFVAFAENISAGVSILQLHVVAQDLDRDNVPFQMPPIPLHRFIRA